MRKIIFILLISISLNANELVKDIAKNTLMTSQKSFESGSHDIGDNSENKGRNNNKIIADWKLNREEKTQ